MMMLKELDWSVPEGFQITLWKLFKNKMIWKLKKTMNPKIDTGLFGFENRRYL